MAKKRPTAAHRAFLKALKKVDNNQSALARICGCTQGNIWQLKNNGSPLPAQYVLKVEAALGIPRHELRPDVFSTQSEIAA